MAFPDRHWARAWRKFVQENFWLDSLQLGQLLLLLLSLLTLLLLLMSSFCCCFFPSHGKRRANKNNSRKNSRKQSSNGPMSRTPSAAGGPTFSTTNEERRRLLQPSLTIGEEGQKNKQIMPSISIPIESTEERGGQMPNNNGDVGDNQKPIIRQQTAAPQLTPYVGNYRHQQHSSQQHRLVEQSPPPPRRLAPAGGKTQVLPLTGSNRRRVPALILLLADQERAQQQQQQGGGPSESRTTPTTGGGQQSCHTIPEDPAEIDYFNSAAETNDFDELLSIDRTLLSSSTMTTATHQLGPQPAGAFGQLHRSFRLASPFPQPPPKFEILPPAYSPPEPPSAAINHGHSHSAAAEDGTNANANKKNSTTTRTTTQTRSNLSSPDQSSYGGDGQTPLNTTTGSSAGSVVGPDGGKVRISELECSDVGHSGGGETAAQMDELDGCWPTTMNGCNNAMDTGNHTNPMGTNNTKHIQMSSLAFSRVPRSISQQLELMEEMAAAAAAAAEQKQRPWPS